MSDLNIVEKLEKIKQTVDWHIEDCYITENTEYNRAWLDAMMFIKQELDEFNND